MPALCGIVHREQVMVYLRMYSVNVGVMKEAELMAPTATTNNIALDGSIARNRIDAFY